LLVVCSFFFFFFSSRRRHTRFSRDWSSDVCSSDLFFSALAKSEHLARALKKSLSKIGVDFPLQPLAFRGRSGASSSLCSCGVSPDRKSVRVGKECRSWWSAERCAKKEAVAVQ